MSWRVAARRVLERMCLPGSGIGLEAEGRVRQEVGELPGSEGRKGDISAQGLLNMPPEGASPISPTEGLVCGVSGPVCAILNLKGLSGGALLGRDSLGSRPQNRTCGMWCGGEQLSHQSLLLASGDYF